METLSNWSLKIYHLPGVDGAVAATEGVALGVLDGVQDGLVFGTEVESEKEH
jgi:hypothetical protein